MKFSILLFVMSAKFKKAAAKKESFKAYIKDVDVKVQIMTSDKKRGRLFIFSKGVFSSKSGVFEDFNVALEWSDANTGFGIMARGKNEETMKALGDGRLKLQGDANQALWFTGAVKEMMK